MGKRIDRCRRWAIMLTAAAFELTCLPAWAGTPIVYAALGDSFSSGAGSFTAPFDPNITCGRTQGAYPVLWAHSHDVSQFSFVACGGAKTTGVISSQLGALSPATTLVTVTAGGNDANGVQTIIACSPSVPLVNEVSAACTAAISTFTAYVETDLPALLGAMFQAIKAQAPYARIVALSYAGTFEPAGSDQGCSVLGDIVQGIPNQASRTLISAAGVTLHDTIRDAALANGVLFADAFPAFGGHRICASSPPAWVNTLIPGLAYAYHPTTTGYANGYLPTLNQMTSTLGF